MTVRQFTRPTPARAADPIQFTILPPPETTFSTQIAGGTGITPQLAVSPDGKLIVFVAAAAGGTQLWLRSLNRAESRVIPGTDGAAFPFWSYDGRTVAFFAQGRLKKVSVDGGAPLVLCEAASGRGGAWNRDNVIIFSPNTSGPLLRVSAAGGIPAPASALDEKYGESNHRFPVFLSGGRHFLFTATVGTCCPASKPARVMIGELDSMSATELMQVESVVAYSAGHLFFNRPDRDNTLMAQPFDAVARRLIGDPFPVAERVGSEGSRYASFSVSETNVLAYAGGGTAELTARLTWMDRSGKVLGTLGDLPALSLLSGMALSSDGQRIVVATRSSSTGVDLFILDAQRGSPSRFTFEPAADDSPIWSPDDSSIVFRGGRNGRQVLLRRRVRGTDVEEELLKGNPGAVRTPTDWSLDGRYILYAQGQGVGGSNDLWALPMFGDGKPIAITQTPENETLGTFSPDSRWFAYASSDRGAPNQIYVQPFPPTGTQFQVSQNGGAQPIWSKDGRELFFIGLGSVSDLRPHLMAAPVTIGADFERGAPISVFPLPAGTSTGLSFGNNLRAYAVSRDGKRFLFGVNPQQSGTASLTVVLNWLALRK